MYHNRIKEFPFEKSCFYLITNRIAGGSFLLKEKEKSRMRQLLLDAPRRSCCKVRDYVILDNHFHTLIEIPCVKETSDSKLLEIFSFLKGREFDEFPSEECREEFRRKAHDISFIIGNFEQRFTQWFNREHNRWMLSGGSKPTNRLSFTWEANKISAARCYIKVA